MINMQCSRGQVSTELLVIIGAILVIFIPLIATGYTKAAQANEELALTQSHLAASRLSNIIESVGNLGENSSAMVEIFVPKGVSSIKFQKLGTGSEVVFTIDASSGNNEIAEISRFPLSPASFEIKNPSQGLIRFQILSKGKDGVEVKRV